MDTNSQTPLLDKIERFLEKTGMGASYFGKASVGNSEIVHRLRKGGRVWPDTAGRVSGFIDDYSPQKSKPPKAKSQTAADK